MGHGAGERHHPAATCHLRGLRTWCHVWCRFQRDDPSCRLWQNSKRIGCSSDLSPIIPRRLHYWKSTSPTLYMSSH